MSTFLICNLVHMRFDIIYHEVLLYTWHLVFVIHTRQVNIPTYYVKKHSSVPGSNINCYTTARTSEELYPVASRDQQNTTPAQVHPDTPH